MLVQKKGKLEKTNDNKLATDEKIKEKLDLKLTMLFLSFLLLYLLA